MKKCKLTASKKNVYQRYWVRKGIMWEEGGGGKKGIMGGCE